MREMPEAILQQELTAKISGSVKAFTLAVKRWRRSPLRCSMG